MARSILQVFSSGLGDARRPSLFTMDPQFSLKLVILDDNPADRELCRRYLDRCIAEPHKIVEHNAIEGALDLVERENPDCILLDYHLHDGDGVEFIGQLASIGGPRRYPVVMLTGTGNETIAVQVMKAGVQDYLIKDRLSPEVLQRAVETAIYKAQTERLLDEQRLEMERLFREAKEANARKDQFLAALSHELRTPLTPVLAAITTVDVATVDRQELRDIFTIIRRNIALEARLIDDLLDLTRISRGMLEVSPRPSDLLALLRHAAEACEADRAAKDIRLQWRLDIPVAEAPADPARIQQVFWNLLKNAIKFTPGGGTITVSLHNRGDQIEITVADTGIGLQPETEERIFEAFVQGDSDVTRRFGGLGLGLAISKALVEAHGGSISAANREDGPGAVFTVRLPLRKTSAAPEPEKPGESPLLPAESDGAAVLLVEDHADSAYFIKLMLDGMGYRVRLAGSVAQAREIFRREKIDFVVSDLGLPDGSGIDLMESIAAERLVPAIALSGYGMESDVQRSLAAGFVRHLTKPIEVHQLANALRSLEEERQPA